MLKVPADLYQLGADYFYSLNTTKLNIQFLSGTGRISSACKSPVATS